MSAAQKEALRWLARHNGDGSRQRGGMILAGGEIGPHRPITWNALEQLGLIERYGEKGRRIRMTDTGWRMVAA